MTASFHNRCKTTTTRLYSLPLPNNSNYNNDGRDDGSLPKQPNDNNIDEDNNNNNINNDDVIHDDATNNIFVAALPPIGTSSFWDRHDDDDDDDDDGNDTNINNNNINNINTTTTTTLTPNNIVVSRKFQLSYTCKLCNTRNTHSITRLGYNHGVVIAICKQCNNKHLLADNLGWSNYLVSGFDYEKGERNIEEYVKNRQVEQEEGEDDEKKKFTAGAAGRIRSLRVDRGVFDLENLWHEQKDNHAGAGGGGVGVDDDALMVVETKDGEDWN
jgi:hypothetical protein